MQPMIPSRRRMTHRIAAMGTALALAATGAVLTAAAANAVEPIETPVAAAADSFDATYRSEGNRVPAWSLQREGIDLSATGLPENTTVTAKIASKTIGSWKTNSIGWLDAYGVKATGVAAGQRTVQLTGPGGQALGSAPLVVVPDAEWDWWDGDDAPARISASASRQVVTVSELRDEPLRFTSYDFPFLSRIDVVVNGARVATITDEQLDDYRLPGAYAAGDLRVQFRHPAGTATVTIPVVPDEPGARPAAGTYMGTMRQTMSGGVEQEPTARAFSFTIDDDGRVADLSGAYGWVCVVGTSVTDQGVGDLADERFPASRVTKDRPFEFVWQGGTGAFSLAGEVAADGTATGNITMDRDGCEYSSYGTYSVKRTSSTSKPPVSSKPVFADVAKNHQFFEPIQWMAQTGLSTGIKKDGTVIYAPKTGVSREAMAAFIYRLEGKPTFSAPKVSPFADMTPKSPFYKEVTWLANEGITTGVKQKSGKPNYQPKNRVSREAKVDQGSGEPDPGPRPDPVTAPPGDLASLGIGSFEATDPSGRERLTGEADSAQPELEQPLVADEASFWMDVVLDYDPWNEDVMPAWHTSREGFTVEGGDLAPNQEYTVKIDGETVGTANANAEGDFAARVKFTASPGTYVAAVVAGGETVSDDFIVVADSEYWDPNTEQYAYTDWTVITADFIKKTGLEFTMHDFPDDTYVDVYINNSKQGTFKLNTIGSGYEYLVKGAYAAGPLTVEFRHPSGSATVPLTVVPVAAGAKPAPGVYSGTATQTHSGSTKMDDPTTRPFSFTVDDDGRVRGLKGEFFWVCVGPYGYIGSGRDDFKDHEFAPKRITKDRPFEFQWEATASFDDIFIGTVKSNGTATGTIQADLGACGYSQLSYSVKLQQPAGQAFADVPKSHQFYEPIQWMAQTGLSTGIKKDGKVIYAPKTGVSREAMAAFIYRLEGKPKFSAPKSSPFADMKPGDKFYKEITWFAEQGITTGVKQQSGKPKYLPKTRVSREAMAAFIYRYEGKPKFSAPKTSPFADMTPKSPFYKEVTWLANEGITTGVKQKSGKPNYQPKNRVSREAMAAFIYRLEN